MTEIELEILLDQDKKELRNYVKKRIEINSNIYISDFLMFGAIKRNHGNINGICLLIKSRNMSAARSLLRVHLDTLLRFQAFWIVDDIENFTLEILGGKSINKFKDNLGNKLTDSYLVDLLSQRYPWVKDVYKNLCSYIHFSDAHVWDSIDPKSILGEKFTFSVTDQDEKYPAWSWAEILECTHEINRVFLKFLESYLLSSNYEA